MNGFNLSSKKILLLLIFTFSLLGIPRGVGAVSLGVAPGILNVGDVYPGQSKLVEFFLITTSKEDMIVSMSSIEPHYDFYSAVHDGHYKFIPEESSNEMVDSWILFPENPVRVSPSEVIVHTFSGGEKVRANKRVRAILNIPEDADPGYHVGSINFVPKIESTATGGLATLAVSRFLYVFYVKPLEGQPGPLRKGKITDVEVYRIAGGRVRFDVLFQNTGTDTVFVRVAEMEVYDNFGELKKKMESGYTRVAPKETKVLSTFWNTEDANGTHRVKADIDFITGSLTADTEVTIPEVIISQLGGPTAAGQAAGYPWWLIIVFVAMLAIIAYFKSDWVWLMVIIGLIMAVLVVIGILLSPPSIDIYSIPWWLIVIIIAIVSLVIYWRI